MNIPATPPAAEHRQERIARVALDVPLPQLFDYVQPEGTRADPGARVVVPFGRRRVVGIVVETAAGSELPRERLRPIVAVAKDAPPLPPHWLALTRFAAEYYQRPLGEAMLAALPPRLRRAQPLVRSPAGYAITDAGRAALGSLSARARTKRGILAALAEAPLAAGAPLLGTDAARKGVRELLAAGWIEPHRYAAPPLGLAERFSLTGAQTAAVDAVSGARGRYEAFLLHGVTGSGKTEVYLRLAADAVRAGKQVLVLVPEINLTPALEREFRACFPGELLVTLTSAAAENERAASFIAAQEGAARVVLGTRLAVFTPLPDLGLVIVDEEHDPSFKQQDGLRYSARDLAVWRARESQCPVVLGSATPSLESWTNAHAGRYRMIALPERARPGAVLPSVRAVDLRAEPAKEGLAASLVAAIEARLARGEQSLIFLNRRGYAPVLGCGACGWAAGCGRCAAHLVVHLADRRLACHHCGHVEPIPRACPTCGNVDLFPFGRGTQRVENVLAAQFPTARILRIDSDSMRGKGRWADTADAIRDGRADILVGTQILSKGHDFPLVTLVGVLNADAALFAADYRAPERLFAQLEQVAGRAGRADRPGEVLIQTRYPHHPLYRALVEHDYARFADALAEERRVAGFPPFVHEAVLRAESREIAAAIAFLREALRALPSEREGVNVYDPVPMTLARLSGWERAHVLAQSPSRRALQTMLTAWRARIASLRTHGDVRWHFDVDPIEF
ncbi:MAG: primosomal protein N' [Burkholderiales bacterium]|nr:primosomal protein N' [Burkholderiales bacterium]